MMALQRTALTLLLLPLARGPMASAEQAPTAGVDEVVWQWFGVCPSSKQMRVDVRLAARSLYSHAFPTCRLRRPEIPAESPQKVLVFSFRSSAALFGVEFSPLGTVEIEGNIWRAGGETDAILLGVSFATANRILLNSIHVARAATPSQSSLAKGLTVSTTAVQAQAK
jgi:hypothetical protein